jgi:hypothetical protein
MNLQNVCIAAAGGFAAKLLNLAEIHNLPKERRPDLRDVFYWVDFLVGPLAGAFLAWVYQIDGKALTAFVSLNVGVSAPLILRKLAEVVPRGIPTGDTPQTK